jgi:Xaa-Pro aminopeptidase
VGSKGLGPDLEKSWVLEPGMVLSVAPYVWEEGVGGFRASETLLITTTGHDKISDFPHGPLAE